jgi:hypothetical protein
MIIAIAFLTLTNLVTLVLLKKSKVKHFKQGALTGSLQVIDQIEKQLGNKIEVKNGGKPIDR